MLATPPMVLITKLVELISFTIRAMIQKRERLKIQHMPMPMVHSRIEKMDVGGYVLMMREVNIFIKLMQEGNLTIIIANI